MTAEAIYRKKESVITRIIAGETILVPIAGDLADMENIFSLNGVGAEIWRLLDGKTGRAGMIDRLLDTFEVTREEAAADLDLFLSDLAAAHLVEEAG